MDEDDDPFSFITTDCHVTSSQQDLHRTAVFARRHERFPTDSQSSNYKIPTESTGIRMLSPPEEEEFLTPEEDSLPAVDLGKDSDRSTVVIEWGGKGLGADPGQFMVVEREPVAQTKHVGKKAKIFEGLEANEAVDLGADQMFDEMPMRNKYSKKGGDSGEFMVIEREAVVSTQCVVKKAKILEDLEASIGDEVVDLGADRVFDEMHTRNEYFRDVNLKMSLKENIRTQVVDLDEDDTCRDSVMREKGDVSTEVVETSDEFLVRNRDANIGINENASTDIDWDEDTLCGDLTTRNFVGEFGVKKGNEVCRDEFKEFSDKGIEEIDTNKCVTPKDDENGRNKTRIGRWRELYDDLSQRRREIEKSFKKVVEPCRDENRGLAENGILKIDKFKKNTEFQNGDNISPKGKGLAEARESPSSLDILAEIALSENYTSGRERNGGTAEKNRYENEKSKYAARKSRLRELPSSISGQTKNNQKMKNVLDAHELPSSVSEQMKNNQIKKNVLDAHDLPSSVSEQMKNNQIKKNVLDAHDLPSSVSEQMKNNQIKKNVLDARDSPSSVSEQMKNNQIKKNVLDARDLPSSVSEQMKNNRIKKNVLDAPSSISGETENNQIMKNILDALGLVTGGQKEKVDDGSNEEVDFLETAMKKGVIFPRPRWWPSEGFKDD